MRATPVARLTEPGSVLLAPSRFARLVVAGADAPSIPRSRQHRAIRRNDPRGRKLAGAGCLPRLNIVTAKRGTPHEPASGHNFVAFLYEIAESVGTAREIALRTASRPAERPPGSGGCSVMHVQIH